MPSDGFVPKGEFEMRAERRTSGWRFSPGIGGMIVLVNLTTAAIFGSLGLVAYAAKFAWRAFSN